MADILKGGIKVHVPDDKNLFLLALKEYNSWFLTNNLWTLPAILTIYLIIVLKVGPEYMKNRRPLNIKYAILFYNLYQSLSNGYMFSKLFTTEGAVSHLVKYACQPMDRAINPFCSEVTHVAWLYVVSKVIDLFDTVFFVLRKKQSHISFLHVYHHTNMAFSAWFFSKYFQGEQLVIIGIVNTFVHTVMYAYYFLAALGPRMQKYLWWKIYVTKLQMAQFVFIIIYMTTLIVFKCQLPEYLSLYIIFQGVIFFALFANFYVKTYLFAANAKHISTNGLVISEVKKLKVM